jgi:hypothetical protein
MAIGFTTYVAVNALLYYSDLDDFRKAYGGFYGFLFYESALGTEALAGTYLYVKQNRDLRLGSQF